ncbi:MAG: Rpn family recombination-promoting nuclease/putative transposase [Bacteroidota bacterium]
MKGSKSVAKIRSFTIAMKQVGTLLIHIEHQSSPEILMPIRLLHYGADSIAPCLHEHKKIPLLIQIVLYHGARTPYPYQTTLQDYYNHPAWGSQELSLRFYLVDLTQLSDAELLKHGHCALLELLFKHGRDGKFELPVDAYRKVFQACVAAVGDPYVSAMLHYAVSFKDQEVGKQVYSFIEAVLTDK